MNDQTKLRILIKGINANTRLNEIKKFFRPIRIKDAKILKRGIAVAYFKNQNDLKSALQKGGSIQGSQIEIASYENDLFINEVKPSEEKVTFAKVPVDEIRKEINENGRLYVRNLSYESTEDDIIQLFTPFGTISEVHLSYDKRLNKSKGFAFVSFLFPGDAVKAFEKLDKQKFKNRLLHILPGKDRPESDNSKKRPSEPDETSPTNEEGENGNGNLVVSEFQRKRIGDLKHLASVSHNWNSLFISPDAVATYFSAKFGVTKEQLLDSSGKESASVRLAHAEAQLVHELREFLLQEGVRIDLLEDVGNPGLLKNGALHGRRDRLEAHSATTHRQLSGTAFIIKNLPVGTKEDEILDLIKRLGRSGGSQMPPPKRVILPPLGITAIVEYEVPQIAKMAYKSLAYEPFNDNVIFVQWAPDGILSPEPTTKSSIITKSAKHQIEDLSSLISEENISGIIADSNINEKKSKKRRKIDSTELVADTAGNRGRTMKLQKETNKTEKPSKFSESSRTILVKNVAFHASQEELTELFKPIGGLIDVRMPKKASGGHRGFAFVEFTTMKQATSALNTFGADTHLYGRRLNIEFAEPVQFSSNSF